MKINCKEYSTTENKFLNPTDAFPVKLKKIPKIIWIEIFSKLNNFKDLINISLTCKRFYIISDNEHLCKHLIHKEFGVKIPANIMNSLKFIKNQHYLTKNFKTEIYEKIIDLLIEPDKNILNCAITINPQTTHSNYMEIWKEEEASLICKLKGNNLKLVREGISNKKSHIKLPIPNGIAHSKILCAGVYGNIHFLIIYYQEQPPIGHSGMYIVTPRSLYIMINKEKENYSLITTIDKENDEMDDFIFTEEGKIYLHNPKEDHWYGYDLYDPSNRRRNGIYKEIKEISRKVINNCIIA